MTSMLVLLWLAYAASAGHAIVPWGPCPDEAGVLRSFSSQEAARAAGSRPRFRARQFEPVPALPAHFTQLRRAKQSCVTFTVPLDWDAVEGRKSSFFARKFAGDPGEGSLVMMQGGPGAAGSTLYALAEATMEGFRTLRGRSPSIIVPDHRGVGYSNPLDCGDDTSAEECVLALNAQGFSDDDLRQFSVTNAAADHVHLLRNERALLASTAEPLNLYGVSYGTFLLSRIILIDPEIADNFVADGLATPGVTKIMHYDASIEQAGMLDLQRCMQDAVCRERFTLDPIGQAWAGLNNICPPVSEDRYCHVRCNVPGAARIGHMRNQVKSFIARAAMNVERRPLIAPILYRLARCDSELDHAALTHFAELVRLEHPVAEAAGVAHDDDETELFAVAEGYLTNSRAMGAIVTGSELLDWARPPISAPLELRANQRRIFSLGTRNAGVREWYEEGVAYPPDRYYEQIGMTSRPFLLLSGDTDPQTGLTTMALDYARRVEGGSANSRHLVVPDALHGVIRRSAVTSEGMPDCGMQMLVSFLARPEAVGGAGRGANHTWGAAGSALALARLNVTCLEDLAKVDYAAATEASRLESVVVLGTADPWGGVA